MFKFKNFKILLLLMLFIISAQNAWGLGNDGYWMYMHIQVDSYPTGAGKVYASTSQSSAQNSNNCVSSPYTTQTSTAEANINNGKTLWYINTMPVDATKWAFVGWVKNASNDYVDFYNANYISTDRNPTNGFNDPGCYASSTENGKGGKVSHSSSTYYPPDPFPITLRMTAVYRSIKPDVIAISNNGELGAADFTDANNSVGETVVLSATPAHYNSKFEGWYKNDSLVSKENPYSFTVTNENKGTYTARFVEHKFMRIKNNTTNRYINGVNDVGSITNFSSLQLESNWDATRYQAGTVVYMWDYTRTSPSAHPYVFDIQGFSSKEYYDDTRGVYVIVLHNNEADTWTISSSDKSNYMADKGASSVGMAAKNAGFPLDWEFEHIDNDLETCENYFSLDPAKLIEVDGKYYTTLRTSWNILFNPEQMTPYIVKSVDETGGTFEMEPITGSIIPLNTPVIIETKSNDMEENRMVPTLTAAASGAVPSGNLLQVSTKYFPNQSAPAANCKGLVKNSNGQLAFGGNALNTVNGNEAYLSIANEVVLPNEITLGALVNDGNTARKHKVIDLTAVALAGNGSVIIAKDNAEMDLPAATGDQVDYMTLAGIERPNNNQSNWVMLRVPEGQSASNIIYANKKLANVQGRLVNKVNPEVQLDKMPQSADDDSYEPNTYIPASFYGTQVSPVNNQTYFFVQPQPMEYATVKWALWDGSKFATVPITGHSNAAGLQGSFTIDSRYLANGSVDNLVTNAIYTMDGIAMVNNAQAGAPARRAPGDTSYVFYPFNIQQQAESIITAVEDINTASDVMSVTFYDVTGRASDMPHRGINIVVTRHRDGTVTTTKVLK